MLRNVHVLADPGASWGHPQFGPNVRRNFWFCTKHILRQIADPSSCDCDNAKRRSVPGPRWGGSIHRHTLIAAHKFSNVSIQCQ